MAAANFSKTALLSIRCNYVSCASLVPKCGYGTSRDEVKTTATGGIDHGFKRGTGGRSSYNGIVATIFGGSGFVAPYIVNKLGKMGTQIIIPYRGDLYDVFPLKMAGDLGQVLFHPFNLRDEESIYTAMKYSNVVINCIGKTNESRNFNLDDVHNTGARTIARLAKEAGVKRLIHFSALNCSDSRKGNFLRGGSKFLQSKWHGEQAVREEFPEAIIFRPSYIWGQEDQFLHYFLGYWRNISRTLPVWKKGHGIIKQPVHISDVAKGVINAIFEPGIEGKTFQAVGPHAYYLDELLDWMHRACRRSRRYGYKRTDLRYSPFFWAQVAIANILTKTYPPVSWETLELESVSDIVDEELPTLADLGVNLTRLEDRIKWEVDIYLVGAEYEEQLGEIEEPEPAKPIQF